MFYPIVREALSLIEIYVKTASDYDFTSNACVKKMCIIEAEVSLWIWKMNIYVNVYMHVKSKQQALAETKLVV